MADQPKEARGITAIAVSGFKSLRDESRIEIRNLTVLAGANSSGKSSIMQPLLLLKQTLEAPYDPGPLKLDGPNVVFTGFNELTWTSPQSKSLKSFQVGLTFSDVEIDASTRVTNTYETTENDAIRLVSTHYWGLDYRINLKLSEDLGDEQLRQQILETKSTVAFMANMFAKDNNRAEGTFEVTRPNIFLTLTKNYEHFSAPAFLPPVQTFEGEIAEILHVPGERTASTSQGFPTTAVREPMFPGRFEYYTAALIERWKRLNDERYSKLNVQMREDLRLTSRVTAERVDANRVRIQLGRSLQRDEDDLVSLEQVGFGVSQILPVLVALLVAEPGQLVYIEQPELHLHPRAQVKLAEIIADAANRGVRVVIETHSELLLLGIQTLVAEGKLATDKVILHWFTRDDAGVTRITSGELDENGAYGDWPQDFDTVEFDADGQYLDAIAKRRVRN